MPFLPLSNTFDPAAPRGEQLPVLWLRSHSPRWAFPAKTTDDEIRSYVLWLHVDRIAGDLRKRERGVRPPLRFRLRLAAYRVWLLIRAADGHLPEHGHPQSEHDDG